jgi:hypothetical protein
MQTLENWGFIVHMATQPRAPVGEKRIDGYLDDDPTSTLCAHRPRGRLVTAVSCFTEESVKRAIQAIVIISARCGRCGGANQEFHYSAGICIPFLGSPATLFEPEKAGEQVLRIVTGGAADLCENKVAHRTPRAG